MKRNLFLRSREDHSMPWEVFDVARRDLNVALFKRKEDAELFLRACGADAGVRVLGDLRIKMDTREVWMGENLVRLTGKEFAVLELLSRTPGGAVTRTMLYKALWPDDPVLDRITRIVAGLRQKLCWAGGSEDIIKRWHGNGYFISVSTLRGVITPQPAQSPTA